MATTAAMKPKPKPPAKTGRTKPAKVAPSAGLTDKQAFIDAIALQEGNSYDATNPTSGAIGKYQVLPSNVAAWTKKALGRSLTPAQFKADHAAQDAVAATILGDYFDKYGAAGAASAWYSGNPNLSKSTAAQHGGPSVSAYVSNVIANMNRIKSGKVTVGGAGAVTGTASTVSTPTSTASAVGAPSDWIGTLDSLLNPDFGGGFGLNPIKDIENATSSVGRAIQLVSVRGGFAVVGIVLFGAGLLVAFGPTIFGGALSRGPAGTVAGAVDPDALAAAEVEKNTERESRAYHQERARTAGKARARADAKGA